jgi:RNA polymerase sigma factor (sigma-70 family)
MNREEELEAFRRLKAGDDSARELIFMKNQRYVIREVWKFIGGKMPAEDLIQEANMGLLYAIDRFDTSRKLRFLTYARWYVRSYMQDAVLKMAYTVTLPKRRWVEATQAMRAEAEIMGKRRDVDLSRRPSPKEVAEYMGGREANARVAEIMRYGIVSANSSVKAVDDGDTELIDTALFSTDSFEDQVLMDMDIERMRDLINDALDHLPGLQRDALESVYGLNGRESMSRQEYADAKGVSRQAVDFRVVKAISNASGVIKRRAIKEAIDSVQVC